jgi:phosphatidylinositol alpha-1,6-mannosyltransferase
MPSELRILSFIRHYPPPYDGGEYYYNYHLFKELQRLGCKITILSHSGSAAQPDDGIKIIPIQSIKTGRFVYSRPISKLGDLISNILVMRKHLSGGDYDFVFSGAGYMGNLTVFIANLMTRIPVVGINLAEEIKVIQQTTKIRAWLQRQLLKSHFINIGISRYTRDLLVACGVMKPSVIIYPFIEKKTARDKTDDRQFLVDTYNLNKDSLIVGFLGRHVPRKGLLNLIESLEKLLQEKKQIILLIAGQGTETNHIKERIASSEYCDHFKFVDVPSGEFKNCFFNGIDVFAMPNYEDPVTGDTEGFGIVFIESAQYGTPVIGGNVGGVVEAVHHQYNGYLVDGQSIGAIAEAVCHYYQNPTLRKLHGQNGMEWAKQFIKSDSLSLLLAALRDKNIHVLVK